MISSTLQESAQPGTRYSKDNVPVETIVIGAGLSKNFGLPLANELLPKMFDWHASEKDPNKLDLVYEFLDFFILLLIERLDLFHKQKTCLVC